MDRSSLRCEVGRAAEEGFESVGPASDAAAFEVVEGEAPDDGATRTAAAAGRSTGRTLHALWVAPARHLLAGHRPPRQTHSRRRRRPCCSRDGGDRRGIDGHRHIARRPLGDE